ncbi:hypothetical protein, partial [Hallerella succinigenes]|uniref:hypothetical protein n=1 Tax=Hallerella succinigenes TaxID=1896222 RepID=UPI002A805B02
GRIGKVEKFRPGSPGASPRELFFLPDSTYISRIDGENSRFLSSLKKSLFYKKIIAIAKNGSYFIEVLKNEPSTITKEIAWISYQQKN